MTDTNKSVGQVAFEAGQAWVRDNVDPRVQAAFGAGRAWHELERKDRGFWRNVAYAVIAHHVSSHRTEAAEDDEDIADLFDGEG